MKDESLSEFKFTQKTLKEKIKAYKQETNKYAIWRGSITEAFKKWLRGGKIYDRDKERVSFYVSEEIKADWIEFIKLNNISTLSKLIRESVDNFIEKKTHSDDSNLFELDPKTMGNISHNLKESLTTIKGFSQLILENYESELNPEITNTIKNILEQSLLLENKIVSIFEDIKTETSHVDILLIEDDLPTIKLVTTYFKSKGHSCKGVITGSNGIEEIKRSKPRLVLLDVLLPDISGYEICKQIKQNKDYQDITVFFLTAIPSSEVEKNIKDTGADGFILKPFNLSDLENLFKFL